MKNSLKSSAKTYVENGYSEFSTFFRIPYKEWDTDFVPNHDVWKDILSTWAKVCIKALESRMDSCVSMLFRNRNNVIKANEHQVVFKKKNGTIHSFNHASFKAMEDMIESLNKDDWHSVRANKLGIHQLLKALYWVDDEDKAELLGIGFGQLINTVTELALIN